MPFLEPEKTPEEPKKELTWGELMGLPPAVHKAPPVQHGGGRSFKIIRNAKGQMTDVVETTPDDR